MANVIFGFLGTKLDEGRTEKRWERWRPSVGMVAHADFPVARVELMLTSADHVPLARQVAEDISRVSPDTEVVAHVLDVKDPWDFAAMYGALHEFARQYPYVDGEQYHVHLTTGTHVGQICLFLLTEARYFPATLLETFSHGAQTTWQGRLEHIDLDLANYDLLASRFSAEREDGANWLKGGISTGNVAYNALIADIEKVCLRSTAPVLLMGPTGAGKSQLAKRLFELRRQRHLVSGSFVEVNCATLRGDNAMSTLFGHKKGAFTGAVADRPGLLKQAHGGTLFLDEIGELGLDEQAMLLRALEDKRFMPLGGDKEVSSDFQLITGTNRNLVEDVKEGRFRSDLLARINVWSFTLPGLAQRPEDIEPNLEYELERNEAQLRCRLRFDTAARARYMAFAMQAPWLGNFRDLAASVQRLATLADGGRITLASVETEIDRLQGGWGMSAGEREVQTGASRPFARIEKVFGAVPKADHFELVQLEGVLEVLASAKSMAEAGRKLFAVSRSERKSANDSDRVKKYLDRWGLTLAHVRGA